MKILLSPAKSMDFEGPCPEVTATRPKFLNQAAQINEQLRDKSPNDLSALMKITKEINPGPKPTTSVIRVPPSLRLPERFIVGFQSKL
jgi:cytoplasmic iron level regulating protein YaaA (DUF328/UPF0246 family)